MGDIYTNLPELFFFLHDYLLQNCILALAQATCHRIRRKVKHADSKTVAGESCICMCIFTSPPPPPNLTSSPPFKLKCHQQFDETAQRKGSINRHARIFSFFSSDAIILRVTETSWPSFSAGKLLSTSSKMHQLNFTKPQSTWEMSKALFVAKSTLDQQVRHVAAVR